LRRGDHSLTLLTDPAFDGPGTAQRLFGLPGLHYVAQCEPALSPTELPALDVVLLSHDQHVDNFDDAGRRTALSAGRVLTTYPAARRLRRKGFRQAFGLRSWDETTITQGDLTLTVTATPARHGPPLSRPFVGATTGFLLSWSGMVTGPLWISGDTVWYRGLKPLARRGIGMAVVHAGCATLPLTAPLRYTMNTADLVRTARHLAPEAMCPVHTDGWSHFREGREQVERLLAQQVPELRLYWVPAGTPVNLATVEAGIQAAGWLPATTSGP
jgi:L-ascorbate metabolism protein UlaG (beta-lactamase superfamily)